MDEAALLQREHGREWIVVLLLLGFGIYQSIIYYQHRPVPSSDFPTFSNTAEPLLRLDLPDSFKRVPMVGFMQIAISRFCPGPYPLLTAGWILNGILHAASVLLLYRVGKHLLGSSAFYFAVLAGINPWILQMVPDPIAETAIVFMTLLTFDFLLRRSRWCYLFAMLASMTRYELTALIMVAFLVDMLLGPGRKERLRAGLLAVLASLPVIAWVVLWRVYRPGSEHYTGHFINTQTRVGLGYWKLLWQTTFGPLLQLPAWASVVFGKIKLTSQQQADAILQAVRTLEILVWVITGVGFMFSLIYSALRKNWKFWALFAFWACYVGAHSIKHKTLDRYTIPVIWLTLLFAFYGLRCMGSVIGEKRPWPRLAVIAGQLMALVICLVWAGRLALVLPATVSRSTNSASLIYAAIAVVAIYLAVRAWTDRHRPFLLRSATILALCGLLLISNQFKVVQILGNGEKDTEFMELADWYRENAMGEKMLTAMAPVVQIFVPDGKILHLGGDWGKTFPEFIQRCYQRDIRYVVWDSRVPPQDSYYKAWNLQKVAPLSQPRNVGPFEFVKKIERSSRNYLYIFKLRPTALLPESGEESPKPNG